MSAATHPLAMVTGEEIQRAAAIVRADPRFEPDMVFAHLRLHEPDKDALARRGDGVEPEREMEALLVPRDRLEAVEVVVSLATDAVRAWTVRAGMRPALLFGEAFAAITGVRENEEWQAALRRRGIEDFDLVQIDPWPAGSFGSEHEAGRRISRCIFYLRESKTDNGYARPIEGLIVYFDMGAHEVLEVVDLGITPFPPLRGSYLPEDVGEMRTDLRPIEIHQPQGASFTVDGNLVEWQKWRLRVGFDPYEGLTLHDITYCDGERDRPVMHRASISEMVVPYGDPGPMHGWKNAFDAGEWGLGRMANSLTLGCDCLGVVHYFDAVLATEEGEPYTVEHAICMHEEDYGILWKHQDMHGGTTETRRSRRLVVSSIATVGNYEYGFYWYFYLDGNIQLEVKLTGIVSPMAVPPGEDPEFANLIAPGLAAPNHQHLFSARLDLDVDGPTNRVYEIEAEPVAPGPDNPWSNAFRQKATLLDSELAARRNVDPSVARSWKVVNPEHTNHVGAPVGYKLVPTMSTPTMHASPDSSVGRRAGFARHNLWVTPYEPDERRAAGDYPNQHEGGDGLPAWTESDRSVTDTDVVLWYTFGVTHFVRPEDWPVMPVEYTGFLLSPFGFFDRNPALDVPPTSPEGSCHA
ncbi:MAG TPA: primary-amine oxidase [Acidimicrobiia bacterium]|nr:primary-amine oxidase [Acidimicrobiia bacterium]